MIDTTADNGEWTYTSWGLVLTPSGNVYSGNGDPNPANYICTM